MEFLCIFGRLSGQGSFFDHAFSTLLPWKFSLTPPQPWFELLVPKRLEVDFGTEDVPAANCDEDLKVSMTATEQKGRAKSSTKLDKACNLCKCTGVCH